MYVLFVELPLELLMVKKDFCKDILLLLEKIRVGQCKIRGLLMFELYLCIEEIKRRENNNVSIANSLHTDIIISFVYYI